MKNLPSFTTYGNYRSDNYGAHCLVFSINGADVYFSYKTPVAFRTAKTGLVVRQNDWGPTTGKHLNWIDGGRKDTRINGQTFEKMLSENTGG
jgi:hypothetical protein